MQWPASLSSGLVGSNVAQIGVSIEPLNEVSLKEGTRLGAKEDFAKKVALNLYHFMTSFATVQTGDQVVVPANCFDRYQLSLEEWKY